MIKAWTRWLHPLLLGLAVLVGGCASSDGERDSSAESETGRVRLSLIGAGQPNYRLRQAEFIVRSVLNSSSFVLRSDDDPDAATLTADLPQDSYDMVLQDGWVVERLEDGNWIAAHGALVTQNPTQFQVTHGMTTTLVYTFAVDGVAVAFGEGSVDVTLDVVNPTELPSCDILNPFSCGSERSCLLADGSGKTFCADAGPLPVGAPCDAERCVVGAQCLSLDPAHPGASTCTRFCAPGSAPFGCNCRSLSFSPNIGVCASGTDVEFVHDFQTARTTTESCDEWNGFRSRLASGSYGRIVLNGSYSPTGVSCTVPALATQICNDLASGTPSTVTCDGHTWFVGFCGVQNSSGDPGLELSVDTAACSCGNYSARPCTDVAFGGGSMGGVGVAACWNYPQTIRVSCSPLE